jgi:hypothetical protein
MKDPVMDPEGNTYERSAIEAWLAKNATSPITRNPLDITALMPNRALKESIDMYLKGNLEAGGTIPNDIQVAKNLQDPFKPLSVDLQIDIFSKGDDCLLSVLPPKKVPGISQTPSDVCCVIDISGSMQIEAKIVTEGGQNEGFGFSVLDLVKHAVNTIIQSLSANDRLALVSYSSEAKTVLPLTTMNADGKKKALAALNKFEPDGQTNLWGGLEAGMEVLRAGSAGKNAAVFLLTDGLPNIIPPRGNLPMLQRYKDKNGIPGIINTFGFGYSLDSKLLNDIAVLGNGAYAFIPDGSFVGTIFVNALSTLLATAANNVTLDIELDKCTISDYTLLKYYSHKINPTGLQLQLGSILFNQEKNLVLPIRFTWPKSLKVTLSYDSPYETKTIQKTQEYEVKDRDDTKLDLHKFRLQFVNEVTNTIGLMSSDKAKEAVALVKSLISQMNTSAVKNNKYIQDLITDLSGEVTQALTKKETYDKWGAHFFPSIVRAHLLQQCNNFKDPGVQNYGGEMFTAIRDNLDDIFVKLPPPKPSVKHVNKPAPQVANMQVFHNQYGGCFAGSCVVEMADGSFKLVQEICKNDEVMGPYGKAARVSLVVKYMGGNLRPKMVEFEGGLIITPYHPVKFGDRWYFPGDLREAKEFNLNVVYDFVLESHHIMKINGVQCVTLGHGFQDDVVKHSYFGTDAIIKDLRQLNGWNEGVVSVTSDLVQRNPKTGLVMEIK